jgi:small subunit ribosomal protein S1
VLELDNERRRLRLGIKQLEPTTVDHYISEHQQGDTVSGRLIEIQGTRARVELGEGVIAICQLKQAEELRTKAAEPKSADVGSLGAMLAAKWKQGGGSTAGSNRAARAGEVRSFRIAALDPAKKLIELELAS